MAIEEIKHTREEKLSKIGKSGANPYPAESGRTHRITEALEQFDRLSSEKTPIVVVGRIMLMRPHGGSAFFHFEDGSGRMQGYAKKDVMGEKEFGRCMDLVDVGDFVEVSGSLFSTKKGEKTIEAKTIQMLAKSLLPLPEKWHGLTDTEERFRKRYLDLLMNAEAKHRFVVRSRIIQALRAFYHSAGFMEVETPMLQVIPGGALAKPFATRMETLDLPLFLRVAPELYLKRLLVGGYENVFEIGRCFRNEGMDKDHNPEFTMLEAYAAYKDYEWLMGFTENLFSHVITEGLGVEKPVVVFEGHEINFTPPYARVDFADALKKATGLDYWASPESAFMDEVKKRGIEVAKNPSKIVLADELFKKVVRPALQQPTFVIDHPVELLPLAKKHRTDPRKVESFQWYAGGIECVKAFTELNDPMDQRGRFEAQEKERAWGNAEGHPMDTDFLEALEYGMPPAAGIGIGIDRLVRLLTDAPSLREVLLFPTMKPR